MTAADGPYGLICDPAPACEPGPLLTFSRDFGLWIPLLFLIAAFIAGLKASRTNVILPALVMGLIAVSLQLRIEDKMTAFLHSYYQRASPLDGQYWFGRYLHELRTVYLAGFMLWSVAPFAMGLVVRAALGWRRNRPGNRDEAHIDPSP